MGRSLGITLGLPELPPVRLGSALRSVDELVEGGLPKGRISEIIGAPSSGKTALAWRFVAAATARGEVAAVIDCAGGFDPCFVRSAGVVLQRLLLVHPPSVREGPRCAEDVLAGGGFSLVLLDFGSAPLREISPGTCVRLARHAEKSRSVLLLLAPVSLARSFSAVILKLRRLRTDWSAMVEGKGTAFAKVLEGVAVEVGVVRNKLGPPGGKAVVHFAAREAPPLMHGWEKRAVVPKRAGIKWE